MKRLEFTAKIRDAAIARANGMCQTCGLPFRGKRPEVDHILPCALGGLPTLANARVICGPCHKAKSADDIRRIRKSDRVRRANNGAKSPGGSIAGKPKEKHTKIAKLPIPPPRNLYEKAK